MTSPPRDERPEDAETIREVYRALKSCGWLLPETIDEVQQAENELDEADFEMPKELLDPLRLLPSRPEPPLPPSSSYASALGIPDLPSPFARLAQEEQLIRSQVITLMGLHSQLLFNRSESKSDDDSYDDLKRFYLEVKDYL